MTDDRKLTDAELDSLFTEATDAAPVPSADLLARVMADADAVVDARATAQKSPAPVQSGWLKAILAPIGGWPAMAGLATATVAGVWIGYSPPESVSGFAEDYLSGSLLTYDLGDYLPSYDLISDEG
ncbi:MAG: dihydroorotate dehydrogenase [Marinosulfonomonas sp.]